MVEGTDRPLRSEPEHGAVPASLPQAVRAVVAELRNLQVREEGGRHVVLRQVRQLFVLSDMVSSSSKSPLLRHLQVGEVIAEGHLRPSHRSEGRFAAPAALPTLSPPPPPRQLHRAGQVVAPSGEAEVPQRRPAVTGVRMGEGAPEDGRAGGGVVGQEGRGEKGLRGAGRELHLDGWNRDRSSGRSWSGREGARRRAAREAGRGWKIPGAGAAEEEGVEGGAHCAKTIAVYITGISCLSREEERVGYTHIYEE